MGRHDKDETKEERLLRKAKEFVAREDKRKSRKSSKKRDRKEKHKSSHKRRRRDESSSEEEDRKRSKKRHKKDKKRHRGENKPKRIKIDETELFPLGDIRKSPPDTLLNEEQDYFAYHQPLVVYLYRQEGLSFGDLTTEDAREAFSRFVDKYNAGSLESGYYQSTLPQGAIDQSKPTSHKWSFQTSTTEAKSLQMIEEGVRKQTQYDAGTGTGSTTSVAQLPARKPAPKAAPTPDRHVKTPQERLADRSANRRLKNHVRSAEEEFAGGRKEGRERQLEKKRETSAALHGAARDREDAASGVEVRDVYGDSDGQAFQSALAREKQRKASRQQNRDTRVAELQQKENDRQEAMFKALGLTGMKPGQKITIAPRKDG